MIFAPHFYFLPPIILPHNLILVSLPRKYKLHKQTKTAAKMKNILSFLLFVISISVQAFTIGGVDYDILSESEKTAYVKRAPREAPEIWIPDEVYYNGRKYQNALLTPQKAEEKFSKAEKTQRDAKETQRDAERLRNKRVLVEKFLRNL